MDCDLLGNEAADQGMVELVGKEPPVELYLLGPAPSWHLASFWVRRLSAQLSVQIEPTVATTTPGLEPIYLGPKGKHEWNAHLE